MISLICRILKTNKQTYTYKMSPWIKGTYWRKLEAGARVTKWMKEVRRYSFLVKK